MTITMIVLALARMRCRIFGHRWSPWEHTAGQLAERLRARPGQATRR